MDVHLGGDEKLPRIGDIALAILSTAGLWFCVLGSKTISLVTRSDSWRMPRFLELGLVHVPASTWIFMGILWAYWLLTLKLVLDGMNQISSSGCYIKQKRSQHRWEFESMEDEHFALMIVMMFLKCFVKDTAPNTISSIPDLQSDPFWHLMFLTCL